MRPLVVLVEILVKPSFVTQFRDLIVANAKTSLEREAGCNRFDVLFDPEEPRRFVLYEIYEDGAAFDEHLASSHYLSFADAIEGRLNNAPSAALPSSVQWRRAKEISGDGGTAVRRTDAPNSAERM
jgi:(4S)-4-hydroxy-5-phosphonooxypentane-2,3-dione isomerase